MWETELPRFRPPKSTLHLVRLSLSFYPLFLLFLFTKTYELYRLTSLSRTKKNPSHEKKEKNFTASAAPPRQKRRVGCWNIQIFL